MTHSVHSRSESLLVALFLINGLVLQSVQSAESNENGNMCPRSRPWPCRTANHCLSFALICDGEKDCPDEYDEDPDVCTAKSRPAVEHLQGFITKYNEWLIPHILGNGDPRELANKLVESKTIKDYAKSVKMTREQLENLVRLLWGVKEGKQIALQLLGMPFVAWNELYYLFLRIYRSGFLGPDDEYRNISLIQKRRYWWLKHRAFSDY
ncbi:unnamed protein product [Calicophoron daubneyi]|uniref:Prohormone-4 n=1 Tax=Calicophoron daubneyi TaxID=300641 RepID=A0AAV2TCD8_CALDB